MGTITLSEDKLKNIIRKTVKETVLEIARDSNKLNAFLESMEDAALGKLMEEADTGEYVDTQKFMNKLKKRINKR